MSLNPSSSPLRRFFLVHEQALSFGPPARTSTSSFRWRATRITPRGLSHRRLPPRRTFLHRDPRRTSIAPPGVGSEFSMALAT